LTRRERLSVGPEKGKKIAVLHFFYWAHSAQKATVQRPRRRKEEESITGDVGI